MATRDLGPVPLSTSLWTGEAELLTQGRVPVELRIKHLRVLLATVRLAVATTRGDAAGRRRRATDAALPHGLVTFVFTDIEGSTELHEALGAAYVDVQRLHDRVLREVFSKFGGAEVKGIGDGLFLAFADPRSAAQGCLEAQRALSAAPWTVSRPVRVRMGIHLGPASPENGDYIALAVNQAARICAAAHGGQVLVSADVVTALGESFDTADLGRFLLRGFARPVSLAQLRAKGTQPNFPAPRARPFALHNLPASRTTFVGRVTERDALTGALGRARLVTLTGPGGAGKTRLAIEGASALVELFADGVWRIPLATIGAPELLAGAVGAALELRLDGDDVDSVARSLEAREMLLVLDNCEHLIAEAAQLADTILAAAPGVRILATSREPLAVEGETVIRVGPLDNEAAVELVRDRMASARPGAEPDDAIVRELVRRLEGIPLALELAAARAAVLTLPEILAGLDDPLRLLAVTRRGGDRRHGSLRAVLDWGYGLLESSEQLLLRRMAVLTGPVSLETVASVCVANDVADIDADLLRLVDKSLVVAETRRGFTRYRLLEPVRAYAQERLDASGELASSRRRLLDWAVELAEAYHDRRGRPEVLNERIAAEHAALLEALVTPVNGEDADAARLRLAGAMARRWALDRPAEALALIEGALAAAPAAAPAVRLRALSGLSRVHDMLSDYGAAMEREAEALELAYRISVTPDVVWSMATMATHFAFAGRDAEADAHLREAKALAEELDDNGLRALVRRREAYVLRERHEMDAARVVALEDLGFAESSGDLEALLSALIEVAIAANFQGDGASAVAYGERALALARDLGLARSECLALTIVQLAATLSDDFERAAEATAEALALARSHGLTSLVRDTLDFAAVLLCRFGRDADVALAHGGASRYPRDSTNPLADRAIASAFERLGETRFAEAMARGNAMTASDLDRHLLATVSGVGVYADAARDATSAIAALGAV